VIVKSNGTLGTTDKATNTLISTTESYISYGSSSDLWGETWTPTDINDIDFGVVYSVYGTGLSTIISHYLKATNFGFSIPSGATINGIFVEVEVKKAESSNSYNTYIDHIRVTVYYTPSTTTNPYSVTRDLAGTYSANSNPAWKAGTPVVKQGSSDGASAYSGGWLRLIGEGTHAPYYSVFARTGVAYNAYTEVGRLGTLMV